MAENIKIGITVDDGGSTNKVTNANKLLRKEVDGVTDSAVKASGALKAIVAPKTTAAVEATMVPRTVNAVKATMAPRAASQPMSEGTEYGQARASVGTGAAGRDFAKQAQGLGGLVHVYATFAANLFAVSAAFTALSNAADTTNMVEGLKQLGAASGTNLILLSKGLVQATDGAISLKAAMTATAQASAAGMSGENIKRLGAAAKNTSLALGIDAVDAVSRLSRGITKLEPELLDELGLFTKLGKATEDYAREIGKPVSALTDFERRQAFANAVLTEAEKKFGNIKIDANPFSKFLAGLKDASQTILEVVNSGVGPLVKALSQSPTTLMIGIGALTALLLQKSIPAFTQYGAQLRASAEQAKAFKENTKDLFADYTQSNKDQASKRLTDTQKSFGQAAETGMEAAKKALKDGSRLYNKEFNNLMKLDPEQLTADSAKVIGETRKKLTLAASKAAESGDPKKAVGAQGRLDTFESAVKNLEPAIANQLKYNAAVDANAPKMDMMAKYHAKVAEQSDITYKKYNIMANAIDNTSFIGPKLAFQSMILSIQGLGDKVGLLGKAWLGLKGTIAIAATSIGMAVSVFSGALAAIGFIVGALSALTVAFGKNGDEAEKSAASISAIKSNGDSLLKTFELLEKSSPLEKLAPKNVAAVTNTMSELSASILQGIKDTEKTIAARGGTDSLTNWFSGLIGRSDEKLLAKQIEKQLTQALDLAITTPQSMSSRSGLAEVLGLDKSASTKDIVEAFQKAPEKGAAMFDKLAKAMNTAAQSGKAYSDGLETTVKIMQELENEFKFTDKFSMVAIKSSKDFSELGKILKGDVVVALSDMLKLLDTPASLVMVPETLRNQLMDLIPVLKAVGTELQINQTEVSTAMQNVATNSKTLDEAKQKLQDLANVSKGTDTTAINELAVSKSNARAEILKAEETLKASKQGLELAQKKVASNREVISSYTDLFKEASIQGLGKASNIIGANLTLALQKAVISTKQAALSLIPKTVAVIQEETTLANKQIDLDMKQIDVQLDLVLELRALKLQLKDSSIEAQKLADVNRIPELTAGERQAYLDKRSPEQQSVQAEQKAISQRGGKEGLSFNKLVASGVSPDDALSLVELVTRSNTQKAAMRGQKNINTQAGAVGIVSRRQQELQEAATNKSAAIGFEQDLLAKTKGISPELRQSVDYQKEYLALTEKKLAVDTEINNRESTRLGKIIEELSAKRALATDVETSQLAEAKRLKGIEDQKIYELTISRYTAMVQQNINDSYDLQAKKETRTLELQQQKYQITQDTIDSDKQKLSISIMLGKLSEDEIALAQRLLDIRQADKDSVEAIATATSSAQAKLDAISNKRELSMIGNISLTPAEEEDFKRQSDEVLQSLKAQGDVITRNKDLKIAAADSTVMLMSRDKAYGESFKQVFKGMEDAIVEFTKTGKLSFSSMLSSFLEGLLRFEIQQQQFQLFKGMGGAGGLGKMASSFFTSAFGTSNVSGGSFMNSYNAIGANAKGNAFPSGIQQFAQGGAFTNSIVNSPTMFKFAKGAGMMGEAGPEAIMPLKRDASGNLGVRGAGNQTSVVVNNYSTAQATTKETTDSRGNRKVEIVIGEIVAGEIGRSGSAVQQSLGNNFNARPAMARR